MVDRTDAIARLLGGSQQDLDPDRYVTDKAMDRLFHYVAEQERDIRKNPLKRTSSLLHRVFGG